LGDDHLHTSQALLNLALIEQARGKSADALTAAETAWKHRSLHSGPDDLHTQDAAIVLAEVLRQQEQHDRAEPLLRAVLTQYQARLPATDPRRLQSHLNLIDLLLDKSDAESALQAAEAARLELEGVLPNNHWRVAEVTSRLGAALSGLRRFKEAEAVLQPSFQVLRNAWGPAHDRVYRAAERLVRHFDATGDTRAAAEYRNLLGTTP
jgi:tetratricopeptide (TPR) repeat protein